MQIKSVLRAIIFISALVVVCLLLYAAITIVLGCYNRDFNVQIAVMSLVLLATVIVNSAIKERE